MKKVMLILFAAAAGLIVLGGALYVSAAAMGGNGTSAQIGNIRLTADRGGFRINAAHDSDTQLTAEGSTSSQNSGSSENSQTSDAETSNPTGSDTSSQQQAGGWTTLDGSRGRLSIDTVITGIDAELCYSDLEISAGRSSYIEWEDMNRSTVSYQITDGILTIREEQNDNLSLNLFGDNDSSIEISLPADTVLSLNIASDLGDLELENIPVSTLEYSGDLGDLDIENTTVDQITAEAGTGDIQLENCTIGSAALAVGMGDIKISGTVSGDVSAGSGMGDVKIKLNGSASDYSFDLSTDMGELEFNNSHIQGSYVQSNASTPLITAKTGMGDVEVEFRGR